MHPAGNGRQNTALMCRQEAIIISSSLSERDVSRAPDHQSMVPIVGLGCSDPAGLLHLDRHVAYARKVACRHKDAVVCVDYVDLQQQRGKKENRPREAV